MTTPNQPQDAKPTVERLDIIGDDFDTVPCEEGDYVHWDHVAPLLSALAALTKERDELKERLEDVTSRRDALLDNQP